MPLRSYPMIRQRLKSPIGFLLAVALIFGVATLTMQFFLGARLNASQSNDPTESKQDDLFNHQETFSYDYEKCKKLSELNLDVVDLKRIRNSYLNELKQLELKRRSSHRTLNSLKAKLDSLRNDVDRLEHKRARLHQSLAADSIRKAELDFNIRKKLAHMQMVDKSYLLFDSLKDDKNDQFRGDAKAAAAKNDLTKSDCLMNDCFDYSKCQLNSKLSIYFLNYSNSHLSVAVNNEKTESSIKFVSNASEACLILAELTNVTSTSTRDHYKKLANFLIEQSTNIHKMNIVLVDTSGYDEPSQALSHLHSALIVSQSQTTSKNVNTNEQIHAITRRTTLASFTHNTRRNYDNNSYNIYFNELIHFSLISQSESVILSPPLLADSTRSYLLSYHRSWSSVEMKQAFNKLLKIHTSINIELECTSDANAVLTNNVGFMCYNRNEREEILCKSSFVLILSDLGYWSLESTHRLIEALRCMSIPVLLEPIAQLRLPLDELIEWDELVIRLPMARLAHLASILGGISEQDLLERRLRAKSLYEAYFYTHAAQFNTLSAALMHRMRLPAAPIAEYKLPRFMPPNEADLSGPNNGSSEFKAALVVADYADINKNGNDDGDSEYLGPTNQPAMESESFLFNYTRSRYHLWNRLFYPFNAFPSTPFDPVGRNEPHKWLSTFDTSDELTKSSNFSAWGGGDGAYMSHMLGGSVAPEQFTIVILAYEREPVLINSLEKYVRLPYLNRIVIVWNGAQPPSIEFAHKFATYMSSSRMHVLLARNNSLNSRFLPFDLLTTDAVLSMDDDTLLRNDEIVMAFRVWRENRDRIVGFPARYHTWSSNARDYIYESYLSCEYSMILTGAAFYHRFYHYAYTYIMASSVRRLVDQMSNCEDIAFNMLVSHLTRKPPLKVTAKWNFYCAQCESLNKINSDNPSIDAANASDAEQRVPISMRKSHYAKRTQCIRYISSVFAYNPLLYSQYRADSVLYRTKLPPGKQKCFKLV
jgi:alpha-1,4-N-acetylglucosaminyltransferase EXTL3